MHRPIRLFTIILTLAALPILSAGGSIQKLKNDKVSVTEETLAPGRTESLSAARPNIIVYLSGSEAEVTPAQGNTARETVRRGEAVFEPAGITSIENAGSSPLRYVRIEFLTSGKPETWGMTGLPPTYKILVENRYARAYGLRIPPHSYEPRHTHHARVVICLSGATLEHILPNGQKQPSSLKTGEVVWRPGATHVGHNMGSTELWVICVEPK
jgi:hypothetical protein